MTITVYTTPACPQCMATKRWLDKRGVSYLTVDLAVNAVMRDYVTDELGYTSAPVITVSEGGNVIAHWSGFNPCELEKYADLDDEDDAA